MQKAQFRKTLNDALDKKIDEYQQEYDLLVKNKQVGGKRIDNLCVIKGLIEAKKIVFDTFLPI